MPEPSRRAARNRHGRFALPAVLVAALLAPAPALVAADTPPPKQGETAYLEGHWAVSQLDKVRYFAPLDFRLSARAAKAGLDKAELEGYARSLFREQVLEVPVLGREEADAKLGEALFRAGKPDERLGYVVLSVDALRQEDPIVYHVELTVGTGLTGTHSRTACFGYAPRAELAATVRELVAGQVKSFGRAFHENRKR